ncbi:A1 family peptidase [Candidatus Bathyarchaeota archaeon]|nr:A1 family peptidase [Candidatus Bathyarchaeota archaeon]
MTTSGGNGTQSRLLSRTWFVHRPLPSPIPTTNTSQDTLYYINASVGTPPQDVRLHLDTGSSDLWVNTPSSDFCSSPDDPCKPGGTYSPSDSSSSNDAGGGFNISYADGSSAMGDYVTDTFRLGAVSVPDLKFGVADKSETPRGILGLGYAANEAGALTKGDDPYDNLPLKLAAEGHTQSAAYSLYLNDLDANRGSILFGGVDRARYEGELATLPVQSEGGEYTRLLVTLTRLEFDDEKVEDDMALAVLLDSGSSLTYLPDDIAETLYKAVGASFSEDEGVATIPCSARDPARSLVFTFSSVKISVPLDELVIDLTASSTPAARRRATSDECVFGVAPADGDGTTVLGDTFMRSAYVVFDLENDEISLAQAKLNSSESDVQEIKKGKDGVPGAKKVENPVEAKEGLQGEGGQGGGAGRTCSLVGSGAMALFVVLAVW